MHPNRDPRDDLGGVTNPEAEADEGDAATEAAEDEAATSEDWQGAASGSGSSFAMAMPPAAPQACQPQAAEELPSPAVSNCSGAL